ncbi:MAG: hypothetical protein M1441_02305 [Candidatus Parvarchaeota archaeon]|jgi:hypothetical protein|nr:hypothetical protein [Candidatus Parvarchaeota archaeon]
MLGDITRVKDGEIFEYIKKFGIGEVFYYENGNLHRYLDDKEFPVTVYDGEDYDFVIRKGKYDVITGLEKSNFLLDKGLCQKLKENGMFVMFKFSSLIEADEVHRVYRNFYKNASLCNDYSVPSLFVSFAGDRMSIKSSMELASFAQEFGYNYKNLREAWIKFSKKY